MLCARDVMTRDIISIGPEATVIEAARLMIGRSISAVPVLENNRLAGIVSEGDLVHRAEIGTADQRTSWWLRLLSDAGSLAEDYIRTHSRYVGDVMTRRVHTVEETATVAEIAGLLDRNRIRRAPVMNGGRLTGIVSRSDLLQAVLRALEQASASAATDDRTIRAHLLDELMHEQWASSNGTSVEVHDGVVSLWGNIGSESERAATRVLAENIAGVRGIEDYRVVLAFPNVEL